MPRRPARLAALLLPLALIAFAGSPLRAEEGAGARELAAGREALARREYPAAVEHLRSAVRALDPARERTALGDAWLQLGIAYLNGLDEPEEALAAFLSSVSASPEPSTAWLWASVTAEILGRTQEAVSYRVRAIAPPPPAPTMVTTPAPAPTPETTPAPEAPAAEPAPTPEPDAVQHFFGETEPAPKEQAKDQKDSKDAKDKEKVDAFQHFFGEKKEAKEQPAPEAKPPGTLTP